MFKYTKEGQTNFYLPCGHTFMEHMMMEEARASCGIEGIKTDRTICELIELGKKQS